MRPICSSPFVGIMILAGLSFSINGTQALKEKMPGGPGFAVVELFTSEGCSSCPAADELAITLSEEYRSNVYFLGYHVDYWNYIGWKDKFSKASYTELQGQYASSFKLNSIYTPQAIVNGKKQMVGSDQAGLRKAIMEELTTNPATLIGVTAKLNKDAISVSYSTSLSDRNVLKIALVQVHAETSVNRGENRDRHLKHINVVREIQCVAISKKGTGEITYKIPGDLVASNLKVIAFIQDKRDLKIVAAADATIQ